MMVNNIFPGRYLAPEYHMHGIVDEKTDIYSFGVLLLEIISGRRAVDDDQQCLVNWVGLKGGFSLFSFVYFC